jgi:uncharacterized protein
MKVLVVAKAPVPGQVKTRLGARIGAEAAAALAAAALLDTLAACRATGAETHLSLAGDLRDAVEGEAIAAALQGWTITSQRGETFAERLVAAHLDAGTGPVVQIGMDTPHVTAADLTTVADGLADHDAVLGPAVDGGWWTLARRDPDVVRQVADVRMSTSRTFVDTRAALERAGCTVAHVAAMTDVDTVTDADLVAALAPGTRFAAAWRAVSAVDA